MTQLQAFRNESEGLYWQNLLTTGPRAPTFGHHDRHRTRPRRPVSITSLILFGVSFVLLLRSPFRMPVGERLFRWIWLGAFGRWFLARAGRGLTPGATASTGTTGKSSGFPVAAATTSRNGSAITDPSLRDLDQRVRALEQWRRTQSDTD